MTSAPTSFAPSAEFGTGYYFGRFAEPNYPGEFFLLTNRATDTIICNTIGNPDPKNLAPTQLVMPDFADSPGGFGVGERIGNATFYLVVMEEYVTGAVSYPFPANFVTLTKIRFVPYRVQSVLS